MTDISSLYVAYFSTPPRVTDNLPLWNSATGRVSCSAPEFQPFPGPTPGAPEDHQFIDLDYSDIEMRLLAQGVPSNVTHSGMFRFTKNVWAKPRYRTGNQFHSPAGAGCGQFRRGVNDMFVYCTASGNARQRRRQIRMWKRQGWDVTQFNITTRTRIVR